MPGTVNESGGGAPPGRFGSVPGRPGVVPGKPGFVPGSPGGVTGICGGTPGAVGGVPGSVGNSPGVPGDTTPALGGKTPAFGGRIPAFGGTVPGTKGAVGLSGLKRGWPFGKKPCAPFVILCRATFPAGLVNAAAAGFVKNRLLFVPVKMFVRPKFVGGAGEKRGRSENGACAIALAATRKLKNVSGVFITIFSTGCTGVDSRTNRMMDQKVCREVQQTRNGRRHFAKKKAA